MEAETYLYPFHCSNLKTSKCLKEAQSRHSQCAEGLTPLLQTNLPIQLPTFYLFFKPPSPLLTTLFQQYKTASEIPDEQKNELMWQSCFFIFRRLFWKNFLKIMQCCIFFYKQHQVEICSKIITISSIKRSQKKNKHSK